MSTALPFAPSNRAPEKRAITFTVRQTATEREILEREAERRGMTSLNLVRLFIAEGLKRSKQ